MYTFAWSVLTGDGLKGANETGSDSASGASAPTPKLPRCNHGKKQHMTADVRTIITKHFKPELKDGQPVLDEEGDKVVLQFRDCSICM
jgi:hypothetical protein